MPDLEVQLHDYLGDIASPRFEVDEIVGRVVVVPRLDRPRARSRRWAWAVGLGTAAATMVLIGGGVLILRLLEADEANVGDGPAATPPPASSAAPAPTTATPIPTSAAPPAGFEPGATPVPKAAMTWSTAPPQDSVFNGGGLGDGWQHINDVVAGGPGLVAVGVDPSGDDENAAVWYSTDGISWTRVPHDETVFGGPGNQTITAVTVGGPGLVAVGGDGVITDADARVGELSGDALHDSGEHAAVWYSADGISWHRAPASPALDPGEGSIVMNDVTAGGPGLVAVGARSHRTEEALAISDFGGTVTSIYQDLDAVVWTSMNGIEWELVPHDDSVFGGDDAWYQMRAVTSGGPGLVAVGAVGFDFVGPPAETLATAAVWTSTDGITWELVPFDDTFRIGLDFTVMNDVITGPHGLTAVGRAEVPQEPVIWSSTNGVEWASVVPDYVTGLIPRLDGIASAEDVLVAVGRGSDNGPAMVWFSLDGGETWFDHPWNCDVMGAGPPDTDTRGCGTSPTSMSSVAAFGSSFVAAGSSTFDAAVWIGAVDAGGR